MMALILPKGIVVNSDEINESIEKIASEPLDAAEIAKFWKVYTTTKRRLLDPTAERLENYWWRIWYSDKKHLEAATVARLFDHISNGPTFVPLRGPPNRVEGPSPPNKSIQHLPGASSTTALHHPRPSGPSTSSGTTTTASSASKGPAPMPHPILKKTRGPSTSGPRPTARFISPHESEQEGEENSPISPNSHVVVQPPSPDTQEGKADKKAGTPNRKKPGFAASTKKKRPVIVRRQSSQTSQSSADVATREAEAAQATSGTRSPLDGPPARTQSKFQENFTPSPDRSASSQLAKKKLTDTKRSSPRKSAGVKVRASSSERGLSGQPGPSSKLQRVENLQEEEEKEELAPEESEALELQRIMLAEANARLQRKVKGTIDRTSDPEPERPQTTLLKSPRSKSAGTPESSGSDAMRLVQHDSKGVPSLAPTLADATGQVQLGEFGPNPPRSPSRTSPSSTRESKGKSRATEQAEQGDMFAKRPVQPVKAAPVADTLTRSKSQLTLLLKQDKEKNNRNEREYKKKK
ncbi:hypothetical protein ONS95_004513 [Cadophora gregata]|uniref:uncharacterized protein n=1 Tax=Cadophora gregata TaxID=51156 RepID=UPI0026DC67AD|nr:uncharacterized protein ONS95_004513 [Cadophora gregata]KAK0105125.1 hypothetical protein ONS96_004527 [Cadophora gregata f. sp. sojae]KAK0106006.1 hypothetical protein ONS95_004513 [Cadophora gregata]